MGLGKLLASLHFIMIKNKPPMNKLKYIAAVLISIAGLGLHQAQATAIPFTSIINDGNDALNGFSGPFVQMGISLVNSTTATVTFTSLTNGGNIYLMGGVNAVVLNVNAASFSTSGFSGSNAGIGFTPGPFTNTGPGNVSEFGDFNLTVRSFDGFGHSSDLITFTLTNMSGIWGTANDVLAFNADGFDAGAHIFVTISTANASNTALVTGFAGEGQQQVPDGGTTMMLLGAALGSLGLARRFLKK